MSLFLLAALLTVFTSVKSGSVELKKARRVASYKTGDLNISLELVGRRGAVLRRGRDISLTLRLNRDAYVVIYDIDSDGFVHLLFPYDGELKLVQGGKEYYLPGENSDFVWEVSGKTGVEYIHAVAVTDRAQINEDELYYLYKNDNPSSNNRFHIDMDPYLAFNMIDELLVRDAESIPPASDFTYFYINKQVDYPGYLCYKCHAMDKIRDPYNESCPEITIEQVSYEQNLGYPYPPLYDISHTGESDYYTSNDYGTNRSRDDYLDNDRDEHPDVYLSIFYDSYDYPFRYYWPSYRTFIIGYSYPAWDYFWWDFGWSIGWSDYYYYYWPFASWWSPYNYYWVYNHRYNWYYCNDFPYYAGTYGYRRIYGSKRVKKRVFNYKKAYANIHRDAVISRSRVVKRKTRDFAQRLNRNSAGRRLYRSRTAGEERFRTKNRMTGGAVRGLRTVYSPGRTNYYNGTTKVRKARKAHEAERPSIDRNKGSSRMLRSKSSSRNRLYKKNYDRKTYKSKRNYMHYPKKAVEGRRIKTPRVPAVKTKRSPPKRWDNNTKYKSRPTRSFESRSRPVHTAPRIQRSSPRPVSSGRSVNSGKSKKH